MRQPRSGTRSMWVGLGEQSLGFSKFLQVAVIHRLYAAKGRDKSVRDASSKGRIAQGIVCTMHSQHSAGVQRKKENEKKSV